MRLELVLQGRSQALQPAVADGVHAVLLFADALFPLRFHAMGGGWCVGGCPAWCGQPVVAAVRRRAASAARPAPPAAASRGWAAGRTAVFNAAAIWADRRI